MRYFWSVIVVLVLLTAGLNALRRSRASAGAPGYPRPSSTDVSQSDAGVAGRPSSAGAFALAMEEKPPAPEPEPAPASDPAVTAQVPTPPVGVTTDDATGMPPVPTDDTPEDAEADSGPVAPAPAPVTALTQRGPGAAAATVDDAGMVSGAAPTPSLDDLLGLTNEAPEPARAEPALSESADAAASAPSEAEPAVEPVFEPVFEPMFEPAPSEPAAPAPPPGPSFEVRDDGSLVVEGVGVVAGDGSAARPFVVEWATLRSVERDYNPKKSGADLPAWIMQLHGKQVRVEGNTLLPLVSPRTDELLVMQNPWDGCCIGVPPTPYDAIEVRLSEAQAMGNAPTGYGVVEGVFKIDPYVVSGWLLGLYMIEEASFESAPGTALPEL